MAQQPAFTFTATVLGTPDPRGLAEFYQRSGPGSGPGRDLTGAALALTD